ncbi:ubiquitin carboxyl-terminal hydrolase 7 [Sporothrix schenckii 1099-18]|uniref:ubiquitinyl hydrolase 1 n=1 Tax=Sporothrix schenckii 1099-18 TaxID=1397361 RepID=A0A0F2MEQ5_SPOSC|nr:ubiquitin carboxyl-terminal hydrolase 7 [Sporothrix schenckii 1099-18]KJR86641.1 ubiquitin carboxyl-terminal hydrolase 7 [Sporothrix schenckii 1099-18]
MNPEDNVYAMETDDITLTNSGSDHEMATAPASEVPTTKMDTDPDQPLANDFDSMKELVLTPLIDEPPILEDVVDTWTVDNWRSLKKKEHGPVFKAGGFPWRILLFPHGNNVDYVSVYLEHGFEPSEIPDDWVCCVQFALVCWNPNDPTIYSTHTAHHRFTKDEGDWGFTRFVELRKMLHKWEDRQRPMIENESVNITAYVRVVEDETGALWHSFVNYDSKKETGFVGLKNQGATCYLNSLLQSLYFTNAFRKAIYGIPTESEETFSNSAYTLQRLFYQLQTSKTDVGTNELTKSFGWESRHIYMQQDVQELCRKLMERMEDKMKGTADENLLSKIFSGKVKTYISCINVEYESSRIEDFWDIQLNVTGNKDLQASFEDYISVERMDGDNKYFAGDKHQLQDANKGVIFQSFPDVLHLQLKRFLYDYYKDAPTKVNDRHEFPDVIDLAPYLSEDADKSEPWTYQLHGVLVHSGELDAGHYYAFLKPTKDGWFYRYDDEKVTKATKREVLEENYGGAYPPLQNPYMRQGTTKKMPIMRPNSAYMLVYIRQSRVEKILTPVLETDIPRHIQTRFEDEAQLREAKRKERDEQHLYIGMKVITDHTFQQHTGFDLTSFDSLPDTDASAPRIYRLLRTSTVEEAIATIAEDMSQDPKRVRLWVMVNRQNKTIRPDQPIMDTHLTVEETYTRISSHRDNMLRVWAEVAEEVGPDGEAIWPTYQSQPNGQVVKNDLILLFLKYFNVEQQVITGITHVYLSKEKKVEELFPVIMKKMGWGDKLTDGDKLLLWEEIKPNMIEALKAKQSLKAAELQDGDVICFQRYSERKSSSERSSFLDRKTTSEKSSDKSGAVAKKWDYFTDAKTYYEFLLHKREVQFMPHPARCNADEYPAFALLLNVRITYDQLCERVGEQLQVEPTHLRFYTVNNNASGSPRTVVKRSVAQNLNTILSPQGYATLGTSQKADALYFEVLEMSLAELETKKGIRLVLLSDGISKDESFDLFVSKNSNTEDLIQALVRKAKIPDEAEGGRMRIYETSGLKFSRVLPRDYPVLSLNDYSQLIAERIPPEELEAEDPQVIQVFHFHNEPSKVHGIPFRFLLKENEPFSETRKRLEARTGYKGKSFEKIKFALVRRMPYSKPQYLNDGKTIPSTCVLLSIPWPDSKLTGVDDILWDLATQEDDFLGLDHVDRTRGLRNGIEDLFLH